MALGLFVLIAVLIRAPWTPLTHLDLRIANDLHADAVAHRGQLPLWRDVSAVFSPGVLRVAAAVVAVAWFAWRRARRGPLVLAAAAVGTMVLDPVAKVIVDRDRPHFSNPVAHAAGQSYPSGHAFTSFAVVIAVLLICTPRARRVALVPGVLVVAAVGFSRLMLGVHYLSDVVGGWLLGAALLALTVFVLDRLSGSRVRPRPAGPRSP